MVRHGRRIRRCGTCVERKVKCDERQPYCQRCENAGLACSGYHGQLKFVDENDRFSQSKLTATPNDPAFPAKPVSVGTNTQCKDEPRSRIRNLLPQKGTLFLPYTLSKLSLLAPRHDATVPAEVLPKLLVGHNSELHQLCVQALTTVYFGRTNRDEKACVQGLRLYSQALAQLRNDINTGDNSSNVLGTIRSVLCLCVFENIVFSHSTAWLMHYEGAGIVLQSRGPKAWRDPDERQVLRFARYFAILSAGHKRRHCFLDQSQWESTRCLSEGETPEKIDLLYDIFAQTPGIVHDYDQLRQRSGKASFATRFLRQRLQSVIARLHTWLHAVPWTCNPTSVDHGQGNVLRLDDPMDAVALALCYAILLCLAQPCEYLGVALVPSKGAQASLASDDAFVNRFLALEICRFADSALQSQESANFALFLIYPLQIAWFCLRTSKVDVAHIHGIMNSVVADRHGFEIGRIREWDESSLDQGRHGFLF